MNDGKNQVINLKEKLALLDAMWVPKIVADLDDSYVKIIKLKGGEIAPHSHKHDEFVLILKGKLTVKLPDREVIINEGECFVSPKDTQHCPYAEDETYALIIEKKSNVNALPSGSKAGDELERI